jgi:hypothetical protein
MAFILRIFDAERQAVRAQEITTASVKIGRSDKCDVVLDSPYVSREHALLKNVGGKWILESVGLNVTSVAGKEIPTGKALEIVPEQEIQIATFSLFVESEGKDAGKELDLAAMLGELELGIHARMLERADLRDAKGDAGQSQSLRLRQIIDELVRQKIPSVSAATGRGVRAARVAARRADPGGPASVRGRRGRRPRRRLHGEDGPHAR